MDHSTVTFAAVGPRLRTATAARRVRPIAPSPCPSDLFIPGCVVGINGLAKICRVGGVGGAAVQWVQLTLLPVRDIAHPSRKCKSRTWPARSVHSLVANGSSAAKPAQREVPMHHSFASESVMFARCMSYAAVPPAAHVRFCVALPDCQTSRPCAPRASRLTPSASWLLMMAKVEADTLRRSEPSMRLEAKMHQRLNWLYSSTTVIGSP
mmetsp:Transcript_55938/g.173437  ORF Transcript_55938/g.173437 Transcript_55938/m.173437 type:complete len:209 (-) Transcript_55938:926-1552(-)